MNGCLKEIEFDQLELMSVEWLVTTSGKMF